MDKQKYLEYLKQWRKNNPDKVKSYHKKWNPIDNPKYNPKRFLFKNKRIILKENPRTGVCSWCGKEGRTALHHIQYHNNDPLKDTVEICPRCHMNEHREKLQEKPGFGK